LHPLLPPVLVILCDYKDLTFHLELCQTLLDLAPYNSRAAQA
jgi:hypothetical protein